MSTTTPPCPRPRLGRAAALVGVSALAGLFLAACGGDSDTPASPPPAAANEVPATAAATSASLEAFAIARPQSETASPLLLDNVPTFPTSETESPIVLP
jgi:hypothetical protein